MLKALKQQLNYESIEKKLKWPINWNLSFLIDNNSHISNFFSRSCSNFCCKFQNTSVNIKICLPLLCRFTKFLNSPKFSASVVLFETFFFFLDFVQEPLNGFVILQIYQRLYHSLWFLLLNDVFQQHNKI